VRLNRHENGLSPSGCRRTCAGGVVVHSQTHGYNLCFHFPNRGEDIWMQWVGDTVSLKRCNDDSFHVITTIYGAQSQRELIGGRKYGCVRYTAPDSFPSL